MSHVFYCPLSENLLVSFTYTRTYINTYTYKHVSVCPFTPVCVHVSPSTWIMNTNFFLKKLRKVSPGSLHPRTSSFQEDLVRRRTFPLVPAGVLGCLTTDTEAQTSLGAAQGCFSALAPHGCASAQISLS